MEPKRGKHGKQRGAANQDGQSHQGRGDPNPVQTIDEQERYEEADYTGSKSFKDLHPPKMTTEGLELPTQ